MLKNALIAATFALAALPAHSQDNDGGGLQAAVQNPISSLVSVPLKFTFDNGAPNGDANVLTIQPVVPVTVGDLNLISRAIIPLYDAPGGVPSLPGNSGAGLATGGRTFGLGDINYTLFFSPKDPVNGWVWGVGPSITAPTATDSRLGAGKWSGGLSAIALNQPGWGTFGGLVRHLSSFAGDGTRAAVSQTLIEPFVNYNLGDGWYLLTDMVITYNWNGAGEKWTVPVGGGFGKLFMLGNQAMNARAEAYYNVVRPAAAPEWSVGFTVQFLFPKS